jgi:hypothetical protein
MQQAFSRERIPGGRFLHGASLITDGAKNVGGAKILRAKILHMQNVLQAKLRFCIKNIREYRNFPDRMTSKNHAVVPITEF